LSINQICKEISHGRRGRGKTRLIIVFYLRHHRLLNLRLRYSPRGKIPLSLIWMKMKQKILTWMQKMKICLMLRFLMKDVSMLKLLPTDVSMQKLRLTDVLRRKLRLTDVLMRKLLLTDVLMRYCDYNYHSHYYG
jgi:hypothetical protein